MKIFEKLGIDRKAKKLSKTNYGTVEERSANRREGATSFKRSLPVATVKEAGKKKMVVGKQVPDTSSYRGLRETEMPTVNAKPKSGQAKKVVKTYEQGKLVMKEKQGKNIFGKPTVKIKTYGEGGFKKGKEKMTLTKIGIKTKSTY